jgi:predicted PurR-regulated permease PerM
MSNVEPSRQVSSAPERFSYYFIVGVFVLVCWLRLATPLLSALLTYLVLSRLHVFKRGGKWIAVGIFLVLLFAASFSLGHFINQTVKALPVVADKVIPQVIAWAKEYEVDLPFTDYDSMKDVAFDTVKSQVRYLGSFAKFARGATAQMLFLLAGCVVAISLFLHGRGLGGLTSAGGPDSMYAQCSLHIAERFRTLYESFVTVMGAQIIISTINTILTLIFTVSVHLPYAVVVVGVTFLCGLIPVVGNLISNTIIASIAFTVSPRMAVLALVFLVVIHKLEYFLNSKIVGWRIHNPLWLTLLGLIVGEKLLGVPGMILAPVVLNYIRLEASAIRAEAGQKPGRSC